MKPELTPEEIARRFADIDSRPPETLTPGEEASLAMAMEDESAPVSLDAFRQDLEEYSGKLVLFRQEKINDSSLLFLFSAYNRSKGRSDALWQTQST